jgi:cytochrome c oxidase cbb3-type subunit 3
VQRKPGAVETTGHRWDGDLAEYNNPLPRWWSWLFYLTIVFSLAYLVLYPGLGSWRGTLGWTQVGQLQEEQAAAEKQFGPLYRRFAATDVETLAKDPEALAVGQRLFLNNCAQCHASDGAGSRGFPNLTDRDWLWGGDAKTIKATISEGRTGVMPPFGPALGPQGVKNVAHYVRSLSGLTTDSLRVAFGRELYQQNCVACHGADGKGNAALGAPNLADKTWLYGSAEATVIETVTGGRTNQMPAHKALLDEARIHLLTAYVLSLSR